MKQLTIKTEKGNALKMEDIYPSEDAARKDLMQRYRIAVDRLAAYEDTGLTPEEIRELKGLWKVVCELYGINTVGLSINNPLTLEELQKMDGEPLWYKSLIEEHGEYFILRVINGIYLAQGGGSNKCAVNAATYGKAWLAYRRRPEEKMQ